MNQKKYFTDGIIIKLNNRRNNVDNENNRKLKNKSIFLVELIPSKYKFKEKLDKEINELNQKKIVRNTVVFSKEMITKRILYNSIQLISNKMQIF